MVYKSVDAGYTWTPVLADVGGIDAQDWVYSLVVDPNAHDTIYAATHEHGPYKSSYYGDIDTWYTIQNGINDPYGLSGRAIHYQPGYYKLAHTFLWCVALRRCIQISQWRQFLVPLQ